MYFVWFSRNKAKFRFYYCPQNIMSITLFTSFIWDSYTTPSEINKLTFYSKPFLLFLKLYIKYTSMFSYMVTFTIIYKYTILMLKVTSLWLPKLYLVLIKLKLLPEIYMERATGKSYGDPWKRNCKPKLSAARLFSLSNRFWFLGYIYDRGSSFIINN